MTEFDEPILEPDLPIIDPHHHVWLVPDAMLDMLDKVDLDDARKIARTYRLHKRYMPDELLADLNSGHNIRATVYAEAHTMYRRTGPDSLKSTGEVEFANGLGAMADSGLFGEIRFCAGIIGNVDLMLGDGVEDVLEAHLKAGGTRYRGVRPPSTSYDDALDGLKHMLGKPGIIMQPEFRKGASRLAAHGLTLDIIVMDCQIPEVTDLARALPDTTIIMDHTGSPVGTGPYAGRQAERFAVWKQNMQDLATCPNVMLKVGGLGMPLCGFPTSALVERAGSEALARDWRPHIETAIELFGTERSMFESNFPIDGVTARYPVIWNTFKRVVSNASPDEKLALFAGNASRIYRIPLD